MWRENQTAQSSTPKARGSPGFSHVAGIAQPHDNDFLGANLTIRNAWLGLELTSSFGIVDHTLDERFDPSSQLCDQFRPQQPQLLDWGFGGDTTD